MQVCLSRGHKPQQVRGGDRGGDVQDECMEMPGESTGLPLGSVHDGDGDGLYSREESEDILDLIGSQEGRDVQEEGE